MRVAGVTTERGPLSTAGIGRSGRRGGVDGPRVGVEEPGANSRRPNSPPRNGSCARSPSWSCRRTRRAVRGQGPASAAPPPRYRELTEHRRARRSPGRRAVRRARHVRGGPPSGRWRSPWARCCRCWRCSRRPLRRVPVCVAVVLVALVLRAGRRRARRRPHHGGGPGRGRRRAGPGPGLPHRAPVRHRNRLINRRDGYCWPSSDGVRGCGAYWTSPHAAPGAAVADAEHLRPRPRTRRSTPRRARPTRQAPPEVAVDAVIAPGPMTVLRRRCCGAVVRGRGRRARQRRPAGAAKTSNWSPSSACAAMAGVRGRLCSSPSPSRRRPRGSETTPAAVRTTTGHTIGHAQARRRRARIRPPPSGAARQPRGRRADGRGGRRRTWARSAPFFGDGMQSPSRRLLSASLESAIGRTASPSPHDAMRRGAGPASRARPHRRTDVAFTPRPTTGSARGSGSPTRRGGSSPAASPRRARAPDAVGSTTTFRDRVMRPRPVPGSRAQACGTAGRQGDVALHVVGEHPRRRGHPPRPRRRDAHTLRPRTTSSRCLSRARVAGPTHPTAGFVISSARAGSPNMQVAADSAARRRDACGLGETAGSARQDGERSDTPAVRARGAPRGGRRRRSRAGRATPHPARRRQARARGRRQTARLVEHGLSGRRTRPRTRPASTRHPGW